jgi:uncharacterized protein GlcG (DUF336 family)
MAIAILDSTGHIVMLHRFDNTQYGSIAVAEDKARSALYYRRPTKVFEDLATALSGSNNESPVTLTRRPATGASDT